MERCTDLIDRYGDLASLRAEDTAEEWRARSARVDRLRELVRTGDPSEDRLSRIDALIVELDIDRRRIEQRVAKTRAAYPRRPRRVQRKPSIRYLYFIQELEPPRRIKIGVASDLERRIADHRRHLGFDFKLLGAMQWRNSYPEGEDLEFEGMGILAGWSNGRAGTAWLAERHVHELFAKERIDKRKGVPWGARHELFRPSPRLRNFIATFAVRPDSLGASRLHQLECRPIENGRVGPRPGCVYFVFDLPAYMTGAVEQV